MKYQTYFKRAVVGVLAGVSILLTACTGSSNNATETTGGTEPVTDPTINEQPQEKDPRMLYNGIYLPEEWPPKDVPQNFYEAINAPYLSEIGEGGTHPTVVNIDVGRQLFVDDFLIESTNLQTVYHKATPYEGNPILNIGEESGVHFKHGGIWYDEGKQIFEMWYNRGYGVAYAYSSDGINWTDKGLVLEFENTKERKGGAYATVIKDTNAQEGEPKFYMLVRRGNSYHDPKGEEKDHEHYPTLVYYSFDGQKWRIKGAGPTSGDASTLIYNCFRDVWQLSLRRSYKEKTNRLGRARDYLELESLLDLSGVKEEDVVFWQRADSQDLRDPVINDQPEIYSLCAVGYESIMLGSFQMLQGPDNNAMAATGIPKITNIVMGYSRDGFYYTRPDRTAFLECSQEEGAWDRGYLHQIGSVCLIVGDELWFYYSGYEGDQTLAGTSSTGGALNRCTFGLAKLRRDGFASLDGTGSVLTRKMTVTNGQKYLFINAVADSVKAEIIDANGNVVEGFSMADCTAFSGDSTCSMLTWGDKDLSFLSGTEFQIRFEVQNGSFYSFWLSETVAGDSNGATAGGLVTLS